MLCHYYNDDDGNSNSPGITAVLSVVRVCMRVYGCVCVRAATVAVVKSRDMHWGLLAQKDHKEVNLSTLRMLLVADGANPCESHVTVSQCLSCLFSSSSSFSLMMS